MLSAGEVAGLIAAMFWAILVCFLVMVLVKLARLLNETTKMVAELSERVVPLIEDVTLTVTEANRQLAAVEAITMDVKQVSAHAAKLSGLTQSLVTGPLIKISALGHGVRRAIEAKTDRRRR